MRLLRFFLVLAAGLWIVVEIGAIPLTNQIAEKAVAARDHNAATVNVSAGTFPLFTRLVLTGKVNSVDVVLNRVAGQRLTFSEVRFDVKGVSVDRAALLQRKFRVNDIDEGSVTATINIADVSPLAGRIASRASVSGHTLLLGGLTFALSSDLFPCSPEATVEGDHITVACSFTEIPPVLLEAQR